MMPKLQPQITRQCLLGLSLCVCTCTALFVYPTASGAMLAVLSVGLFISQLHFAHSLREGNRSNNAVYSALAAFPDAVVVVRADGTTGFQKEFDAPTKFVLPLLVAHQTLAHPVLVAMLSDMSITRVPMRQTLILDNGRVVECRATPFNKTDALLILRDITEAHVDGERIRYLATHDSLTGLLNRNSFHVALGQAISRAHRSGRAFGLLFLDLDHFKSINDSLGHEAGDYLLKTVAVRVMAVLRKSDSVYRLAGDEFTVIVDSLATPSDVKQVGEKLCAALALPYFSDEAAPAVSVSIGGVVYPAGGASEDELLRAADRAMYEAKASGRNCFALACLAIPPTEAASK